MPNLKLEGKDLGIIAGGTYGIAPSGIFLYKPENDLVPHHSMSPSELQGCLPEGTKSVNIIYSAVRQVELNNSPVWRNRNSFDLTSLGINPYDQVYWGRGDISVEFRDDVPASFIDDLVERILKSGIGMEEAK